MKMAVVTLMIRMIVSENVWASQIEDMHLCIKQNRLCALASTSVKNPFQAIVKLEVFQIYFIVSDQMVERKQTFQMNASI